jgi:hypothetical protein
MIMVRVAQMVRALDCGSRGRGFESPLSPFFYERDFGQALGAIEVTAGDEVMRRVRPECGV